MRKHCVRKWIHAICDLLPLFVIPIFALAVRSDNNYQPISIDVGETQEVTTINYRYTSNEVQTLNDINSDNIYYLDNYTFDLDKLVDIEDSLYPSDFVIDSSFYLYNFSLDSDYDSSNCDYYNDGEIECKYSSCHVFVSFYHSVLSVRLEFYNGDFYNELLYDFSVNYGQYITFSGCIIQFDFPNDFKQYYNILNNYESNYISLPQYTNFNIIDSVTTEIVGEVVTYNDTDVGSQMVYTLYNTCDKYFNFNQIGVFNDLYGWFKTNLFNGGNVPLSFTIVWNVILFEFVMDLIFLTYMVFMFVIDFTEHLIDGFFDKAYRGGR